MAFGASERLLVWWKSKCTEQPLAKLLSTPLEQQIKYGSIGDLRYYWMQSSTESDTDRQVTDATQGQGA